MIPCTCPTCLEELEVTCPNRCPNAYLGAVAMEKPAALTTRAPRGHEQPHSKRYIGSREKILAQLTRGPLTARQLNQCIGHRGAVSVMLGKLVSAGVVSKELPAGRVRGAVYKLATTEATV